MEFKEEYKSVLATIKSKLKSAGKPSRNEDIAQVLGYNRSYFSYLIGSSGNITEEHLKYLKLNFKELLENTTISNKLNEKDEPYNLRAGVTIIDGQADAKEFLNKKDTEPNGRFLGQPTGIYKSKANNEFIELSEGSYLMITPLVTKKAHAGYITGWGDEEFIDELPKHSIVVDKPYKGEYLSFEIIGDSMDDGTSRSICAGDIATGRKIERNLWRNNKLHLNKYNEFIIVTIDGILVKEIIKHDVANNTITFRSYNQDKKTYPDTILKLDHVMQIFNVVEVSNKRNRKLKL